MLLSRMVRTDEEALICDFAETYHILNYRTLPLGLAATLAAGLREESRIKMKLAGTEVSASLLLQAHILDTVRLLWWAKTKDAQQNRNRPKSIAKLLAGHGERSDCASFRTPEAFHRFWEGGA